MVITVGLGMNLALLALHAALKQLADNKKRFHYVLVSVHSFETSGEAKTVEAKLATRLGWKLFQCGDASNMVEVIRAQSSSWEGCKVLLLSHLPKPKQSSAGAGDDDGAVFHRPGLRLLWPVLQTVQFFTARDKSRLVHLADIHPLKNKEHELWLKEKFGPAFLAPLKHYRSTTRVHHMRMNVRMPPGSNVRHIYMPIDLLQSLDGWKWTPLGVTTGDGPELDMNSAPHHTVVKAAADSVFSGITVSSQLQQELLTQTMTHLQTNEQRLMSVRMWMQFLHLRGTPAEDALVEVYPCLQMILQVTGQRAPDHLPTAVACGTGRWCKNCETALGLLGKCALVPLLTDMLSALLAVCGDAWTTRSTEEWAACPLDEPHDCGSNCPFLHS